MADPVRPIQMVGSPANLPPDLAARAAQAALAQQVAQAMLANSMSPEAPVIHTSPGNPFARDVPNLNPLGKMVQSLMGQRLGEQSGNTLADINSYAEALRQRDFLNARAPYQVPAAVPASHVGVGEGFDMKSVAVPPSLQEQIYRLGQSSHPSNQAWAEMLTKALLETEPKLAVSGRDLGSLASHIDPASFDAMFENSAFMGLPILKHPENARSLPLVGTLQPGEKKTLTQVSAAGGATPRSGMGIQPPENALPGPGETVVSGENKAVPSIQPGPGDTLMTVDPRGRVDLHPTPRSQAGEKAASEFGGELKQNYTKLQGAVAELPNLVQAAQLMSRAKFGITNQWKIDFLRLAKDVGFKTSEQDLGNIQAAQTAVARLMPLASIISREFNTRAAAQIVEQAQEAAGASPKVDPNHVIDVSGAMVADIINKVNIHNDQMVPAARDKTPLGKNAEAWYVNMPNIQPHGIPWDFQKDETTGMIVNKNAVTPRGPAFEMRRQIIDGVHYIETEPGKWSKVVQ